LTPSLSPLSSGTVRRLLTWCLAVGAVAWVIALVAAPYLAATARPRRPGLLAAGLVYVAGSVVCHQRPARTLFLFGNQLPVCARCFGLYAGAAGGAVAALIFTASRPWRRRRDRPPDPYREWRILLVASAIPTGTTAVLEFLLGADPGNGARLWAAVPLGAAAAWIVVTALERGGAVERRIHEVNCADAHSRERTGHGR